MYSLTRNFLKVASAATVVALTALSTPASADEIVQNLGPVPAHQPIVKTVGNKNVLAFFEPGNGQCNLQAVIWNVNEIETNPTRIRVSLEPGQSASVDSSATDSIKLRCGANADGLAIVDDNAFVAAGAGN
jgi:hypothetical protein